jgi:hypothetical protein
MLGRHGGGVSCDTYYSDGDQALLTEEPAQLTVATPPDSKQGSATIEAQDGIELVFRPCCGFRGTVGMALRIESCQAQYETTPCAVHPIDLFLPVLIRCVQHRPLSSVSVYSFPYVCLRKLSVFIDMKSQ